MAEIKISNSFNSYKEEFKKDVGIQATENNQLYAMYVTTRLLDKNNAVLIKLLNEVINLPVELREELKGVLVNKK